MSVVYATSLKSTRMGDVVTAIGTGGKLKIYSAGGTTLLAQISLANPCGTVSGAVLTFSGTPLTETSADASGTAAVATITDSSGTVVISGLTVSSTSGDIVLSSTNIVAGQPITITAASITHG